MEIITIIALVVVPICAVLIGQYLQDRAKKREEQMNIFKELMTARIYAWTERGVHALNLIDVVFANSKNVRNAWKDYRASLTASADTVNAKTVEKNHHKLLEAISNELGYKGKITWEDIQDPYIPTGLYNMWEEQSKSRKGEAQLRDGINAVLGPMSQMFQIPVAKKEENNTTDESKKDS